MRVSYKMLVLWSIPYAIMSVLGAISTMDLATASEYQSYLNDAGNPEVVTYDAPSITDQAGGIKGFLSSGIELIKTTAGTFTKFVKMAMLDYDFFQVNPILETVRWLLIAGTAPLVFTVTIELGKALKQSVPFL
ncbi:MAG: hypothetical protein CL881_02060 [Dehalococcoidia bacterium]|nr:hypothetical protein [Dehalococcoidia bacterium]